MKTPCVRLSIDVFLSTLSLRRATGGQSCNSTLVQIFYPRSPCGERQAAHSEAPIEQASFSIHALLAESDRVLGCFCVRFWGFFYPRSPCGERLFFGRDAAESWFFYPRSPCGERRQLLRHGITSIIFLSTLSLRRATEDPTQKAKAKAFLSTLSLRRATSSKIISSSVITFFYPRSPCGERLENTLRQIVDRGFSIHALLAESDGRAPSPPRREFFFYPRSPCGERLTDRKRRAIVLFFYPRSPCGERLQE